MTEAHYQHACLSFLKFFVAFNDSKTEVIVFGPTGVSGTFNGDLGDLVSYVKYSAGCYF